MNSESPLLAPFAKIERAKTQIDRLNSAITSFFEGNPYVLRSNLDSSGIEIWRFVPTKKPPAALSVEAGEILHNIRTPLDQMLAAIALLRHTSANKVAFPFGRTADDFKSALAKQKKLPPEAIELIENLKPYQDGGNTLLYAIHSLNQPDKHRPGLVPINLHTTANMTEIGVFSGMALTVGPRSGQHLIRDSDGNLSQADRVKRPEFLLNPPRIVFHINDGNGDDMEVATTTPGTQFYTDFKPTVDIAFRKIGIGRKPIVAVLNQMRDLVEGILLTFERRFFS
jgi:hypothetical protein